MPFIDVVNVKKKIALGGIRTQAIVVGSFQWHYPLGYRLLRRMEFINYLNDSAI